ncbi:hypothetical protein [Comamonas sp. wu1-DMT]|uniref:hypothetical protein n=1 Tax=Comamonas sp. wu1-DMT TaxID=3126390 RepID=UPI0032E4F671
MKIVFVRAFLPHLDARMGKYARALSQSGSDVKFIGWARGQDRGDADSNETFLFERNAALGGRWRNVFALLAWNFFVFKTLMGLRKNISIVHVVDLESAIFVYIFCRLFNKSMVFDIYDHYADTRNIRGGLGKVISAIERKLAQCADLTILADEARMVQHGLKPASNLMIVENVPDISWPHDELLIEEDEPIKIGYFGVLEKQHRGLENLLEAFSGNKKFELHFAGYGPLEEKILEKVKSCSNIRFYGALTHEQGMKKLSEMHCVVGFYYLTVPNHRFASPNKYYEHLLLGLPLLTTYGTPPGNKVVNENTGWALSEGIDSLLSWADQLDIDDLRIKGKNARDLWEKYYKNYAKETIGGEYLNRLKRIARND